MSSKSKLNRVAQEDAYGNVTRSTYYMNGKLKEKEYPDGTSESFSYDLTGKIGETRIDRAGNTTRIFNNIFDKPYRVEYPDNTFETFKYSSDGNLTESTDKAGSISYFEYSPSGDRTEAMEFVTSDAGYDWYRLTSLTYDESGNVLTTETFRYGKPKQGGTAEVKESAGDGTEYTYDRTGRLTGTFGPNGRETLNVYDVNGSLVKQSRNVNGTLYDVKRYTYDSRLRLTGEAVLVKTGDISSTYLSGAKYDSEYSDMVACGTTYAYYGTGKLKTGSDAAGNTTSYGYDYDGRVIQKTDPMKYVTTYKYDITGNLLEEKNPRGAVTAYGYDSMNRLIRKTIPAAGGGTAVTRYIYDASGNLTKQIQPNSYSAALDTGDLAATMQGISYTYDSMNRRTATVSPAGEVLEAVEYDAKGNVIKVVDGLRYTGNVRDSQGTVYIYDGLNRVTSVTDALGGINA